MLEDDRKTSSVYMKHKGYDHCHSCKNYPCVWSSSTKSSASPLVTHSIWLT